MLMDAAGAVRILRFRRVWSPTPGPSPLVPRGEGRIRLCCDWGWRVRRAPPPARHLATSPNSGGGTPKIPGSSTCIELRPTRASPPAPPARSSRRGENSVPLRRALLPFSLPHAVCGGGSGRGAAHPPAPSPAAAPPVLPHTNLPQQFWGRWARFTSPEGASRTPRTTAAHRGPCRVSPRPRSLREGVARSQAPPGEGRAVQSLHHARR